MFAHYAHAPRRALRAAVRPTDTSRRLQPAMLFVLALLAVALLPFRADAQLGKLKKLGEQAAREAVAQKIGASPEAASASTASGGRASSALDITDERIGIVLTALAPQVEVAKREHAARAVEKAYAEKTAAFDACVKKSSDNGRATFDPDNFERAGKYNEQLAPMLQRSAVLNQSPARKREALFLADSMAVISRLSGATIVGAKCGTPPYRTAASIDAEVARSQQTEVTEAMEHGPSRKWTVPASQRGGMTTTQFGLLRERIALWTLIHEGSMQPTGAKFTDAEQAALSARAGELKALAPLFLDGTLTWSRWQDLTAW